jgi:hypothetical protein
MKYKVLAMVPWAFFQGLLRYSTCPTSQDIFERNQLFDNMEEGLLKKQYSQIKQGFSGKATRQRTPQQYEELGHIMHVMLARFVKGSISSLPADFYTFPSSCLMKKDSGLTESYPMHKYLFSLAGIDVIAPKDLPLFPRLNVAASRRILTSKCGRRVSAAGYFRAEKSHNPSAVTRLLVTTRSGKIAKVPSHSDTESLASSSDSQKSKHSITSLKLGNGGDPVPRDDDAERNIIEYFEKFMQDFSPTDSVEFNLVVNKPPCPSCTFALLQLQFKYGPNLKINLSWFESPQQAQSHFAGVRSKEAEKTMPYDSYSKFKLENGQVVKITYDKNGVYEEDLVRPTKQPRRQITEELANRTVATLEQSPDAKHQTPYRSPATKRKKVISRETVPFPSLDDAVAI